MRADDERVVFLLESAQRGEHFTCTCDTCKGMCEHRPCWPTPDGAEALIEAGYAERLMLDKYIDLDYSQSEWGESYFIGVLCPASEGHEGRDAPGTFWGDYKGCVFHTGEGLCELHDAGLKPLEGRIARCTDSMSEEVEAAHLHEYRAARRNIRNQWDTERGRELVRRWKDLVGYDAT